MVNRMLLLLHLLSNLHKIKSIGIITYGPRNKLAVPVGHHLRSPLLQTLFGGALFLQNFTSNFLMCVTFISNSLLAERNKRV